VSTSATLSKADRLYWIKYNPNEWQGMYGELNDEEYGLFHRIIARLWATPGNRLTLEDLLLGLRATPDSHRAGLVSGLVGYALQRDADGMLFVTAIDDAFSDALKRGKAGSAGGTARWEKAKQAVPPVTPTATPTANPEDF
jgi:hypothetical protein